METQNMLNQELKALLSETKILLKTIDAKRGQVSEGTEQALKNLKLLLEGLGQENVLLQSLPRKIEEKLNTIIPHIAGQLIDLNEKNLLQHQQQFDTSIEYCKKATKEICIDFERVKSDINHFNSRQIKKYLIGFGVTLIFSILASLGASYVMMTKFPQRVQIESPGNVTVQESEVSLWSSKNVNVNGNLEKRRK